MPHTKVWAAGVQASPLAKMLADATGAECDRAGRIAVLPDCSLPGHPEVFAIGDMMSLDGLPGVAEVAMQQGIHAARTITQRLRGEEASKPFSTATWAAWRRSRASAPSSASRASASPASSGWLMWLFVHLAFLTGFKNRFTTVLELGAHLHRERAQRADAHRPAGHRQGCDRGGRRAAVPALASPPTSPPNEAETSRACPAPRWRSARRHLKARCTTSVPEAPSAIIGRSCPAPPGRPGPTRSRRSRPRRRGRRRPGSWSPRPPHRRRTGASLEREHPGRLPRPGRRRSSRG